jgi:histidinol dehydrogenase
MHLELQLPGPALLNIYRSVAKKPVNPDGVAAYAPGFSAVRTWFDAIWDTVQDAIADVYQQGDAKITEWTNRIRDKIALAKQELGDQAEQLVAMLQENLLKAAQNVQTAMISLLPTSLSIRSSDMPLNELTVQYQLTVGADVTAAVAAALRMSAGTTVSVSAKYAL